MGRPKSSLSLVPAVSALALLGSIVHGLFTACALIVLSRIELATRNQSHAPYELPGFFFTSLKAQWQFPDVLIVAISQGFAGMLFLSRKNMLGLLVGALPLAFYHTYSTIRFAVGNYTDNLAWIALRVVMGAVTAMIVLYATKVIAVKYETSV